MYMSIIYTREPKTGNITEISHKRFLNKKDAESGLASNYKTQ